MYKLNLILNNEYLFGTIIFNIIIYIFLVYNIFSLFFVFDIKYVKTLTDLKNINYFESITTCIILTFLSFAGIPPLLGFISKFVLFIYFLIKVNIFILFFIIVFNLFVMFFYLQNIRFIVSKNAKNYFNIKNNFVFLDKNLLLFLVLLNVFAIFGIFIIDDILIFLNCICSYLF